MWLCGGDMWVECGCCVVWGVGVRGVVWLYDVAEGLFACECAWSVACACDWCVGVAGCCVLPRCCTYDWDAVVCWCAEGLG